MKNISDQNDMLDRYGMIVTFDGILLHNKYKNIWPQIQLQFAIKGVKYCDISKKKIR